MPSRSAEQLDASSANRTLLLDQAVDMAWRFLVRQAEAGFPEARHEMLFPRAAGFSGPEKQSSDIFSRATLGALLLDIADLDDGDAERAVLCRALAHREADYVAQRKVSERHGGWSYFPDLPELPPDVDSLSAALLLFARCRPAYLALCEKPLETVLREMTEDGSIETWIISAEDSSHDREQMRWGVSRCWGRGTDPDVLANLCHALGVADKQRFAAAIERGARKLAAFQDADGSWKGTWYAGRVYGTALGMQVFAALEGERPVLERGRGFLKATQRADGAWGSPVPSPLDTAISSWALQLGENALHEGARAACDWLVGIQNPDGSWFSSPWIEMPIGRPDGSIARRVTWESITITTAFCLRSLCRVKRQS